MDSIFFYFFIDGDHNSPGLMRCEQVVMVCLTVWDDSVDFNKERKTND